MSIDRISISNPNVDRSQSPQGIDQGRYGKQDRQPCASDDNLSLSSRAKEIDRFTTDVEKSRTERLNEVRRALEAGTYDVAGTEIARALIDTNKL